MNDGGGLGPESWVDGVSDGRDQGWPDCRVATNEAFSPQTNCGGIVRGAFWFSGTAEIGTAQAMH